MDQSKKYIDELHMIEDAEDLPVDKDDGTILYRGFWIKKSKPIEDELRD